MMFVHFCTVQQHLVKYDPQGGSSKENLFRISITKYNIESLLKKSDAFQKQLLCADEDKTELFAVIKKEMTLP